MVRGGRAERCAWLFVGQNLITGWTKLTLRSTCTRCIACFQICFRSKRLLVLWRLPSNSSTSTPWRQYDDLFTARSRCGFECRMCAFFSTLELRVNRSTTLPFTDLVLYCTFLSIRYIRVPYDNPSRRSLPYVVTSTAGPASSQIRQHNTTHTRAATCSPPPSPSPSSPSPPRQPSPPPQRASSLQ